MIKLEEVWIIKVIDDASAKAMGYVHLLKDYDITAILEVGKGIKLAWPKPGFIA